MCICEYKFLIVFKYTPVQKSRDMGTLRQAALVLLWKWKKACIAVESKELLSGLRDASAHQNGWNFGETPTCLWHRRSQQKIDFNIWNNLFVPLDIFEYCHLWLLDAEQCGFRYSLLEFQASVEYHLGGAPQFIHIWQLLTNKKYNEQLAFQVEHIVRVMRKWAKDNRVPVWIYNPQLVSNCVRIKQFYSFIHKKIQFFHSIVSLWMYLKTRELFNFTFLGQD